MNGQRHSVDALMDQAEFGVRSAHIKAAVTVRLQQQEAHILNMTMTQFRTGLLTAEQARDAIAQISALREFAHALDKEIGAGGTAQAQLTSPPSPAQGTAARGR